jgi:hypothetical protein
VALLQNRLIFFFPDSPHTVKQISALAEELGGAISPPTLTWKYWVIKTAFGWPAAKRCWLTYPDLKHSVERSWDQLMYNLERV